MSTAVATTATAATNAHGYKTCADRVLQETSITKFTFRSPRKVGRSHSEPMAFIEDAAPGF
jgi:hypothetical protein